MSANIEWRNPPTSVKGPGARARFAAEVLHILKARPNTWARIKTYDSQTGAWTSAAVFKKKNLLPGVELKARRDGEGSSLYARYVGRPR